MRIALGGIGFSAGAPPVAPAVPTLTESRPVRAVGDHQLTATDPQPALPPLPVPRLGPADQCVPWASNPARAVPSAARNSRARRSYVRHRMFRSLSGNGGYNRPVSSPSRSRSVSALHRAHSHSASCVEPWTRSWQAPAVEPPAGLPSAPRSLSSGTKGASRRGGRASRLPLPQLCMHCRWKAPGGICRDIYRLDGMRHLSVSGVFVG